MTFPILSTGAVTQLPAATTFQFQTQVLRYCDGSEQRFPVLANSVRKWEINLVKVTESELSELEHFFRGHKGRFGTFEFVDPWTGSLHARCAFAHDELRLVFGPGHGSGRFQIEEVVHE